MVVITGAGSGLGRALARRLGADGDLVVLLGRTLSKLQAVADEIGGRAMAVRCDVGSPDSVRAAFAVIAARHPIIDVLINNAAQVDHVEVAEAADAEIVGSVSTNLTGAVFCARAAIPLMRRGGQIFNVSSGAVGQAYPGLAIYAATKAALERFSLSLQQELEPQGISVTIVRAGQMVEGEAAWDDPEIIARAARATALGLDPRQRPSSRFSSVAEVFRALIDLPADVCAASVVVRPRVR
ncbi:SDR family NAD(P)-dependent oxidoreductase [Phenylobacterium sp. LjRoot219]|uniref:SDR family oxidoreductase n=1 Tax=Phenylobacterium sp. LjRoot219 TaxID=3342283 RepID=UPI003ECDDFD5